jgi:hypothetical protein
MNGHSFLFTLTVDEFAVMKRNKKSSKKVSIKENILHNLILTFAYYDLRGLSSLERIKIAKN